MKRWFDGSVGAARSKHQTQSVRGQVTVLLAVLFIGVTHNADAGVIPWIAPGAGDWFDGGNWSGGTAPGPSDDAFVTNGGTAVADLGSPGGATPVSLNRLAIGFRDNALGFAAAGTVNGIDVDINVAGDLDIGVTDIPIDVGAVYFSSGNLTTQAGANADGDVSVNGAVSIGSFKDGGIVGTAAGLADIAGSLTGGGGAHDLSLGRAADAGHGTGELNVGGDLSGLRNYNIGTTGLLSTGNGDGILNVSGSVTGLGDTLFGNLVVGSHGSSGDGTGVANIGGGVFDLGNILVGAGSTDGTATALSDGTLTVGGGGVHYASGSGFSIGTTNGDGSSVGVADITGGISGYELLEVGVTRITNTGGSAAGTLAVRDGAVSGQDMHVGTAAGFGTATGHVILENSLVTLETLTLGNGSTIGLNIDDFSRGVDYSAFDLGMGTLDGLLEVVFGFSPTAGIFDLMISESMNGLLGDFAAVSVTGLALGTSFTSGIEIANINSQNVAIYRLRVGDSITVPEPGVLWLLLLATLVFFRAQARDAQAEHRQPVNEQEKGAR